MEFNLEKYVDKKKILKWETFNSIKDHQIWEDLLKDEEVNINLKNLNMLTHDGLIWIAYICLFRSVNKNHTFITLPYNTKQIAYLKYIAFDSLIETLNISFTNEYELSSCGDSYLPGKKRNITLRKLQFVNRTNWASITNGTLDYIKEYLIEKYDINPLGKDAFEIIPAFTTTLQELLLNIILHGGNEDGNGFGFVAHTPYPIKYRYIRYCFNDIGIGFKNTLLAKHSIKSNNDSIAILNALLYRYYNKKDSIVGLYPILNFIMLRDGRMGIRSGLSYFYIDFNKPEIKTIFRENYNNPTFEWLNKLGIFYKSIKIPGTHIFIDLKLPYYQKKYESH